MGKYHIEGLAPVTMCAPNNDAGVFIHISKIKILRHRVNVT